MGTDAIVWQNVRGNSHTPSPVLADGKRYVLTDSGMLSVFDAKSGTPFYAQQRLPKPYNFKSSPVAANGKLYLASEEGDVIVVKMGEKYEVLATNTLADQIFIGTPAIVDGEIYLRGTEYVVLHQVGVGTGGLSPTALCNLRASFVGCLLGRGRMRLAVLLHYALGGCG